MPVDNPLAPPEPSSAAWEHAGASHAADMRHRLVLGLLAGIALIASGNALVAGNLPLVVVFLLAFRYWSFKTWRPDL